MNETQPTWLPDWAWKKYLDAHEVAVCNSGGYPDDTEMQVIAKIHTIVFDKECAPFWTSVTNRHKDVNHHGNGYEADSTDGRLVVVLYELGEAALGIQPQNKLTASERKRKGEAIAVAASRLRQALNAICVDDLFPGWFYDGLDSLDSAEPESEYSADYQAGKDAALFCYKETTGAYERAGRALAESKPDVAQSRAATADRTRFIRFATTTMRRHYGSALRDATAALTRALFRCDMDSSTVAKIAP